MTRTGRGPLVSADRLDRLAAALVLSVVALAPLPAGSNRPLPWMVWAAVLGLGYALHLAVMVRAQPNRPPRLLAHGMVVVLALAAPAFGLVQVAAASTGMAAPLATVSSSATALGVVRMVSYAAFFGLVAEAAGDPGRARRMAWALVAIVAGYALWLVAAQAWQGAGEGWAPFVNRNSRATFLGMGLCVGLALVLDRPTAPAGKTARMQRMAWGLALWLGLVLVSVALLQTRSRLGFAATLAGLAVVIFVLRRRITGRFWRAMAETGAALALAAGIGLAGFGGDLVERGVFMQANAGTRAELYAQVIGMIGDRPWTGFGLDGFPLAFQGYHAPPVSPSRSWDQAHDSYLTLWAELGLVAGSLPLLALLIAALRLRRIARAGPEAAAGAVGALGAMTVAALHSLGDFSLEIEANTLFLLAVIGVGLAPATAPDGGGPQRKT